MEEGKFIIATTRYESEGWNSIQMRNGYYLSYRQLRIVSDPDQRVFLLGRSWQVCPDRPSPQQFVRNGHLTLDSILQAEYSWAGRYALVIDGRLYLDYGGQMGVFYMDGACSNSLSVLRRFAERDFINPKLNHDLSPDFVLGMRTMYQGISRLLPSQWLYYTTGSAHERKVFAYSENIKYTVDELFNRFEKLFVNSLQNMGEEFKDSNIFVALSGGYDSRTTLAALQKSGVPFSAFTLEHPNISQGDIALPPMVCERLGVSYHFIPREKNAYQSAAKQLYQQATEHMVVDEDVNFYAYGQYGRLVKQKPVVILRNGLWATIREPYFSKGPVDRARFRSIFPGLALDANMDASFREYMDYVEASTLNADIALQDRIYLDIRVGCWRADIEGGFDAMEGIESVDPVNSRALLHLLKMLDHEQKVEKKHEVRLTNDMAPQIADIPYEKQYLAKNSWRARWHAKVRAIRCRVTIVRQWGIAGLLKFQKQSY